ncbi:class II aldolase/adducin family protein [Gymnodinialimonas ceratoperidinii]|uniref:Class II aldolase/adducin family protein n=1 Tax=Gymnodinialimonas ceratoperidinii TaxID=2856823 RepID=A0A8F6TV73_9RHOB|nr:class II aldolase/adducin family protein [Gymnodinialimonas ceratoperidinii]QXT39058.1 class II aldolase/adducin family protein [Gymnodinialimonas ceratoperidinii]
MKSRWNDGDAEAWINGASSEADRDLRLRVYTSRLIGQDPELVLHGGGNTSVKTVRDWGGAGSRPVLHVKGSGWDLDSIEEPGLPALDLEALVGARQKPPMDDPEMVSFLRENLMDPSSPNPSVETLLHAFLPGKFVDHSHATSILVLANQPNASAIGAEVFGDRLALVPYVMPGYDLSIEAAKIYHDNPDCEGLWLDNHGLFTFGETARESYERMITFVTMAEDYLATHGASLAPALTSEGSDPAADAFASVLTSAVSELFPEMGGVCLDFRTDANIRRYLELRDLEEVSARGTITPDHVIRVKPRPVVFEKDQGQSAVVNALTASASWYRDYFTRNAGRASEPKTMLDPAPRVALVRGLGLFGLGKTAKEASIAADLAVQGARVIEAAEAYGTYRPIAEPDLFDMEYWSLEQAKLKNG